MQALQLSVIKKKNLNNDLVLCTGLGFLKSYYHFVNYLVFYRIIMPHRNKHLCGCHYLGVYSPNELFKSHLDVALGDMVWLWAWQCRVNTLDNLKLIILKLFSEVNDSMGWNMAEILPYSSLEKAPKDCY